MDKEKSFQSYLVIGTETACLNETSIILGKLSIMLTPNSPDTEIINPVKSHITIEQIRDLKRTVYQKPLTHKYKVTIIKKADTMTPEAQNALLKIFEEPPTHALLILCAESVKNLLPTIVSRAVTLKPKPKDQTSTAVSIFDNDIISALETVAGIDNYEQWLNEQILTLYNKLKKNIDNPPKRKRLEALITSCSRAKVPIMANVNPKLTISSLILSSAE